MQQSNFIELTTTRVNPHIDPALHIWGWEVPVYLFLGGLAAGILILSSYAVLARRKKELSTSATWLPLAVVPMLVIGLTALFLDLEYKLHVFRFYTTFQVTAPMSWGSWILGLVFVTSGLATLYALFQVAWFQTSRFAKIGLLVKLRDFVGRHERGLASWNLGLGIALGIYTGILLSAFSARPLWNSSVLGLLFLASGLSSGAAFAALVAARRGAAADPAEHLFLVRFDLICIVAEAGLIGLWIIGLLTGTEAGREAATLILGGPYTAAFWSLVVAVGLVVPAVLEVMALRSRWNTHLVAPVLVLVGGIALRFILVDAGQASSIASVAGLG